MTEIIANEIVLDSSGMELRRQTLRRYLSAPLSDAVTLLYNGDIKKAATFMCEFLENEHLFMPISPQLAKSLTFQVMELAATEKFTNDILDGFAAVVELASGNTDAAEGWISGNTNISFE